MFTAPKQLIIDLELLSSTDQGKIFFYDLQILCTNIYNAGVRGTCPEHILSMSPSLAVDTAYEQEEFDHVD